MTIAATARPITFINTVDTERARAFYAGTLGLTQAPGDAFAMVFDLGGATLRVTTLPDFTPGAHPVLGWQVDDIAATIDALVAGGVVFTIYPGMGQDERGIWTAPDGRAKVAFFPDPDGNLLSLTEAG